MIDALSPREARHVIRALRSGVVTPGAAKAITAGTGALEDEFATHVQELVTEDVRDSCLVLQGDWGCGKSHMRMLFTNHLSNLRIPFIDHCLDGGVGSLSHLHRSVPIWFQRLTIGDISGLRNLLLLDVLDWGKAVQCCGEMPNTFKNFLSYALRGWPGGWFWALGHGYHTPDYPYQHIKARDLLMNAVDFLHEIGTGGIVLLIDEAENISRQHDIRGRRKSYDTFGRMLTHARILPVLFVTDRFFDQVWEDRDRARYDGWQNWSYYAKRFLEAIPTFVLMHPPVITNSLAREIMSKIASAYRDGYGTQIVALGEEEILRLWRMTSTRPVRLLVRMTVDRLDLTRIELQK